MKDLGFTDSDQQSRFSASHNTQGLFSLLANHTQSVSF